MYFTETTIDAALGISFLTLFMTIFILSLVCPILMEDDSLGPNNVFIMFAILSAMGGIYAKCILKETKGLSDKEKKQLFMPQRYK